VGKARDNHRNLLFRQKVIDESRKLYYKLRHLGEFFRLLLSWMQLLSFLDDPLLLPVGVVDPPLKVLYSLNTSSLCLDPILPRQKQL